MFPHLYYIEHVQHDIPDNEQLFDLIFEYRSQGSVVRYIFNEYIHDVRADELSRQKKYHVYKTSVPHILAVAIETNSEKVWKRLSMSSAPLTLGHCECRGSDVIYHFEDDPLPWSEIPFCA
jgi:hypothetical protein